jgi:two-component system OmpR family sensor kinase
MSRLRPSSLTGRLVVTAVALVALVSLLIAAATTVAIRSYLTDKLDTEVQQANTRAVNALRRGLPLTAQPQPHADSEGDGEGEGEGEDEGIEDAFGQGVGTLTAYLTSSDSVGNVITRSGDRPALSTGVLQVLDEVPADGAADTIDLPALGDYRLLATDLGNVTVVTGLPMGDVDNTLGSLIGWEVIFTALGVLAAGGAALVVVRRQLRPLREVASTAHEVAQLPLSKGEVGVTARVPERLTDERSEVGQVGAALNTLLGHVEDALDARQRSEQQVRQFVADASHELRTPLATIHGYAELSRRTSSADPEQLRRAMGKVEAETERMSALVEDLLLLARLDAGRPLERTEVDLTKLVLESVGDARVVAPDHRWTLDLEQEPVTVTGDEHRLHQVVTNLLNNARRHTPPGTKVTVGVRPGKGGAGAVVTVHDDGPGIPEDLQRNVFTRFTRGDTARTRDSGGAGLGLSLAHAITTAHGGDLVVSSRPGSTTFTLTLPEAGGFHSGA